MKAEIDGAIEEAKAAAHPEAKELWTDVYRGALCCAVLCCAVLHANVRSLMRRPPSTHGWQLTPICALASTPWQPSFAAHLSAPPTLLRLPNAEPLGMTLRGIESTHKHKYA